MAKRANNEGTIHQLPSKNWRCQVILNGKRLSFTAKTKRGCADWLKEKVNKVDAGLSLGASTQTLEEYLKTWLSSIQNSVRPGTYYQYSMTCRLHILPALGRLRLCEVHPALIQKLYASKLQAGISPRTVEIIHAVLHRAFEQAVKLDILGRNPVKATTPPKVQAKEMHFYDESQANQLLLAARGNRNEALYHLAIATGLRQSELLGLKWADLDWQKRSLRVQRQLKRGFKKGDYFSQPKTKNGCRTVVLGKTSIALLRDHMQRQNLERIIAGDSWQESDLIFPTPIGTPKNQSNLYREFMIFITEAGLPKIRFHDLRHSAATIMLNHGVPAIIVSKRLGHYKVSMTLDIYGHLIPEMQNDAAELIDELISPIAIPLHTVAHDSEEASNTPPK